MTPSRCQVRKRWLGAGAVAQCAELPRTLPAPMWAPAQVSAALTPIQLPAKALRESSGRWSKYSRIWPLLPTLQLQAPGFSLAQVLAVAAIWGVNQWVEELSLSLPFCHSFKINKHLKKKPSGLSQLVNDRMSARLQAVKLSRFYLPNT